MTEGEKQELLYDIIAEVRSLKGRGEQGQYLSRFKPEEPSGFKSTYWMLLVAIDHLDEALEDDNPDWTVEPEVQIPSTVETVLEEKRKPGRPRKQIDVPEIS